MYFALRQIFEFWPAFVALGTAVVLLRYLFAPPASLRHIPQVPVIPVLWSYACGEVEGSRIKRLVLPFAIEGGENVVLVYALGRWVVHVLDYKIAKHISDNISVWPKEEPPNAMLLWRFVGKTNVIFSNGENWKRHSNVVKSALNRNLPIETFVGLGRKLFAVMGKGGCIRWDDLTMRFTLDAVGTAAFGLDFNAIEDGHSPFVQQYEEVMESIASPLYLLFPRLEKWLPRREVIRKIDTLVGKFQVLLEDKKQNKGNDMLTYMLEEPGITDEEYRDNMVVFFIAGHDTTAGAMSSLVYYLAKYPHLQAQAREEVFFAMGNAGEPNIENLRKMPFAQACIRESLRINTPITYTVPRTSAFAAELQGSNKSYYLPPGTPVILNICAIHHNGIYWPNPEEFDPFRFTGKNDKEEARMDVGPWLPFGLGPRQCPARNFAMYEMRTLAAMLLQQWEWRLPENSPHRDTPQNGFSSFALSLPKDLDIEFVKRS